MTRGISIAEIHKQHAEAEPGELGGRATHDHFQIVRVGPNREDVVPIGHPN
jgi:hypothetical protein